MPRGIEGAPALLLALAGLSFGASAFLSFGFYDLSSWGPLALLWLSLLLAVAIVRPALPSGPALAAVAGLAVLFLWSLLSTRWAESAEQALVDADRWLFYLIVLATLLLLVRGPRFERWLLAGAIAPVLVLAAYLLIEMMLGDGSSLFLNNRLNDPVEYVNATAAFLLIGFWPMVAVAERARSAALAGAGLAAAVILAGLAVMTQSRGGLAALLLSAVVVLAVVPGRVRRGWALVVAAAALAVCSSSLGDVISGLPPGVGAPDGDTIESAARTLLFAAAGAGLVWVAATMALPTVRRRWPGERPEAVSAGILVTLALAGFVAVSVPPGDRIDRLHDQYREFVELRPVDPNTARFASGGGNRYDYWRVAVTQFGDHPLRGYGAGNYDGTYYQERRTSENIRQPHSIELQALAETGLVGGAALILFIAGALAALWGRARGGGDGQPEPALTVAAGGAFVYWLLHTSVDWLHLIPGLTGIALCALAVLLAPHVRGVSWAAEGRGRAGVLIALAAVAIACSVVIARPVLAEDLRSKGFDELNRDPEAALDRARDSLALDDEALSAYYLESAALSRMNLYEPAREALLEASRREPNDYVTWALLGDLAVRRGDLAEARRYYREATRLNPRDVALAKAAANPAAPQ